MPNQAAGHTGSGRHALEDILNADAPLLTLQSGHTEDLFEQCRAQVRRSGQAVYRWQEDDGLRSLREAGVRVPGCARLGDTLRYVLKSMHFGIYLMAGVTPPLRASDQSLLQRIARTRTDFVRRVVLISDGPELAQHLGDLAIALPHDTTPRVQLRLRDGRWVT